MPGGKGSALAEAAGQGGQGILQLSPPQWVEKSQPLITMPEMLQVPAAASYHALKYHLLHKPWPPAGLLHLPVRFLGPSPLDWLSNNFILIKYHNEG